MDSSLKQQVIELCQQHLSQDWRGASSSRVQVHRIEIGVNNRIFSCQLLQEKVIVRLYGSSLTAEGSAHRGMDEETELSVVSKLAEKGLHPKILASFPGGRIEEFIHGRNITVEEVNDRQVMLPLLMKKLAQIHSVKDVPMKAETRFSFDVMQFFLDSYLNHKTLLVFDCDDDRQIYANIQATDFSHEKSWLQSIFSQIETRNVFSHTDFQRGNIMILQPKPDANNNLDKSERVTAISLQDIFIVDYEYSGLNLRWGDIAYFFCDTSCSSYDPNTDSVQFPFLDQESMSSLISVYLEEWTRLNPSEVNSVIDSTQHVLLEVTYGQLIVHIMMVLFFLAFVRKNHAKLHNWKYIRHRLQCYLNQKKLFQDKYPSLLSFLPQEDA